MQLAKSTLTYQEVIQTSDPSIMPKSMINQHKNVNFYTISGDQNITSMQK